MNPDVPRRVSIGGLLIPCDLRDPAQREALKSLAAQTLPAGYDDVKTQSLEDLVNTVPDLLAEVERLDALALKYRADWLTRDQQAEDRGRQLGEMSMELARVSADLRWVRGLVDEAYRDGYQAGVDGDESEVLEIQRDLDGYLRCLQEGIEQEND